MDSTSTFRATAAIDRRFRWQFVGLVSGRSMWPGNQRNYGFGQIDAILRQPFLTSLNHGHFHWLERQWSILMDTLSQRACGGKFGIIQGESFWFKSRRVRKNNAPFAQLILKENRNIVIHGIRPICSRTTVSARRTGRGANPFGGWSDCFVRRERPMREGNPPQADSTPRRPRYSVRFCTVARQQFCFIGLASYSPVGP
jgi:hypothetical protein